MTDALAAVVLTVCGCAFLAAGFALAIVADVRGELAAADRRRKVNDDLTYAAVHQASELLTKVRKDLDRAQDDLRKLTEFGVETRRQLTDARLPREPRQAPAGDPGDWVAVG